MQFVSRAEWGARPSRYKLTRIPGTRGVKVHYEGSHVPASLANPDAHGQCAGRVRAIQAQHLADDDEDYADVAYSAIVCPHGYVYEGRGAHHQTGANGTAALNRAHYAVCAMVGNSGLTEPTPAQLDGILDAIAWLRADGDAGDEIKGHKDGHPTACPGGPLYAWVQRGAPRPGGTPDPGPAPTPGPKFEPFPGAAWFKSAPRSPIVTAMGRRLVAEGCGRYRSGPGPQWTDADRQSYAAYQRKQGHTGTGADGWPGPKTWAALKVPKV
ncbi:MULTISPECIES: peptidoglycan-binding protein [unclassified Streptomyces]|uniref:peptidoglycan-binding protein n=1 Tax=unclassified Streptomyces TaxID=2593676 RepID=UPI003667721F